MAGNAANDAANRARDDRRRNRDGGGGVQVAGDENANPNVQGANRNLQVTVNDRGLDTFVPQIPEPQDADIIAKFKHKTLDKIDGRPTYAKLKHLRSQLVKNARGVKSSFGGGKKGHVGLILSAALYAADGNATAWEVPETEGPYPIIDPTLSGEQKKRIIGRFIVRETDIKKAEAVELLLKNQLTDAVDDDYITHLADEDGEYDDVTIHEILDHLFKRYGKLEVEVEGTMERFRQPPNFDEEIEIYYKKQQECQKVLKD